MSAAHRRLSARRAALYAALVTVVFLLLLELGLRLFLGSPPSPAGGQLLGVAARDPDYGWRLQPGSAVLDQSLVHWERRWGIDPEPDPDDVVSPSGFRDTPLAFPKPPDQLRVLAVGDSSVYGQGVRAHLRFTEVLERRLNPAGQTSPESKAVEVINGGLGGWSSYQSLVQLEDSLDLGLDAVVVYSMNSDMMVVEGGTADFIYFGRRRALGPLAALGRLALVQWGARWRQDLQGGQEAAGQGRSRRVPPEHYRANLRRFAEIAEKHQLGLVFVIPVQQHHLQERRDSRVIASQAQAEAAERGLAEDPDPRGSLQTYETIVALTAWESGRPLVDAPFEFERRYRERPEDYQGPEELFADGIHPARAGHALLADLILGPLQAQLQELDRPPNPSSRPAPVVRAPGDPDEAAASPTPFDPTAPPPGGAPSGPGPEDQDFLGVADLIDLGPCKGRVQVGPAQVLLRGTVVPAGSSGSGPQDQRLPLFLALVSAGPAGGRALAGAQCSLGPFSLALPRDLGSVRLVAVLDEDHDGPCWLDRVVASDAFEVSGDALAPLSLELGSWREAFPWGPPFDLSLAARPLLRRLDQGGLDLTLRAWRERGLSIATIIDPALRSRVDFAEHLDPVSRSVEELGIIGVAVDALDRPGAPLVDHDAWLVVQPLGGDLAARVQRAVAAREPRLDHAWTDPDGLSWTFLVPELPTDTPVAAMPGLLEKGAGWRQVQERGGSGLPVELED